MEGVQSADSEGLRVHWWLILAANGKLGSGRLWLITKRPVSAPPLEHITLVFDVSPNYTSIMSISQWSPKLKMPYLDSSTNQIMEGCDIQWALKIKQNKTRWQIFVNTNQSMSYFIHIKYLEVGVSSCNQYKNVFAPILVFICLLQSIPLTDNPASVSKLCSYRGI